MEQLINYKNFQLEDSIYVYNLLNSNTDISYWCGFNQPETLEECQKYVESLSKRKYWMAIIKDNKIIGCISLVPYKDGYELGYWLIKEYRHQGIMQEAIKYWTNFAFENLTNKIYCGWFEGNEKSKNLQLNLGFKEIGVKYVDDRKEYETILIK